MSGLFSPQDALVATMIMMSAVDREMSESELREIDSIIAALPAFEAYDRARIGRVAASLSDMLQAEEGLEAALGLIIGALPNGAQETAYALACDVAAADGEVQEEERRLLDAMAARLRVDRLVASAIERAARARRLRFT